jgi:hypothetical protein
LRLSRFAKLSATTTISAQPRWIVAGRHRSPFDELRMTALIFETNLAAD